MTNKEETLVTGINGKEYKKEECRKIKGNYYKIGDISVENSGDVYYIDDKYRRVSTGYIKYDHRIKKYVMKNTTVFIDNGVVGFEDNGEPIFGSFSKDPDYPFDVFLNYKGGIYILLNEDIVKDCFYYMENLKDGIYYNRTAIKSVDFIEPSYCSSVEKNKLSYDSKDITKKHSLLYDQFYKNDISDVVKKNGTFIKDYTFGLEFETTKGIIPDRIYKKLGLIPLRDGSIDGLEYVTIPLAGTKGIQTVIDSLKELRKRTTYDKNCSLHLHIGNVPRTEQFFIALFKLLVVLEDEFFALFPLYKKYNYGFKKKAYTKKFPINETLLLMDSVIDDTNITRNFSVLYEFLSMGRNYMECNNNLEDVHCHPSDPKGTSKWQIKSRYHYVNMIPLLFTNKQTIEFRIHTPTLDTNKIINYIAICTAIINFAKTNTKSILSNPRFISKMSIKDVIYKSYININPNLVEELYYYIGKRRDYIYNCVKNNDIEADEDNFKYISSYVHWNNVKLLPNNYKKRNPYIISQSEIEEILSSTAIFNNNS